MDFKNGKVTHAEADTFNDHFQKLLDEEGGNQLGIVGGNATLKDLVAGLNALGVGPRDMITILQNIKAAGALQADIQSR